MNERPDFDGIHAYLRERYGSAPAFIFAVNMTLDTQGIKPADLARRMGDTDQHVHRWLKRKTKPGLEVMLRMDEALLELVEERNGRVSGVPEAGPA